MKPRRRIRRTLGDRTFNVLNNVLMVGILVVMLYPFWYCIILSLNDPIDYYVGPLYLWPRKFSVENYQFVLQSGNFPVAITNSVLRTILATLLHCIVTGAAAYGLSKRRIMFRGFYTKFFVFTMYFGGGLIPGYLLIRGLGLLDNFLVYVIPAAFSFYNCILFMAFYDSIPPSLEESARIDGAGMGTIFFKIVFPVSKPIFATVALYSIVGQWNSWMDTMLYTRSESLSTLQSLLMNMIKVAENLKELLKTMGGVGTAMGELAKSVSPTTVRVAAMVITVFPIVVVYPFFQKYFVKGIMLGAVKE